MLKKDKKEKENCANFRPISDGDERTPSTRTHTLNTYKIIPSCSFHHGDADTLPLIVLSRVRLSIRQLTEKSREDPVKEQSYNIEVDFSL